MKRSHLVVATICLLYMTGCGKDEPVVPEPTIIEEPETEPEEPDEPESPVYFRYNDGYDSDNEDTWVIVHDSNDELLEYKKFEPGAELIFESTDAPVPDKITVTILTKIKIGGNVFSFLNTYMEVEKWAVWSKNRYASGSGQRTGSFDFYVTNVPDWSRFHIAANAEYGAAGERSTYGNDHPEVEEGNIVAKNIGIYTTDNFFFSLTDQLGKSKYRMVPNIVDGDSISVDGTELLDFDTVTSIDLPIHHILSMDVSALFKEKGAVRSLEITSSHYRDSADNPSNAVKLYYLDDFEDYKTYVNLISSDYGYTYVRV